MAVFPADGPDGGGWRTIVAGPVLALGIAGGLVPEPLEAQEGPVSINEVLADNGTVEPFDVGGGSPDMIELHNASDLPFVLGKPSDAESYYLSDTTEFDPATAWRFPSGRATAPAGGFLIVFCDGDTNFEGQCELHASFQVSAAGDEPITLWGPVGLDGTRPVVDQVWLPPLSRDVSFGRYPDGAGPVPVPLAEVLDHFVYNPAGSASPPTFGGRTACTPTGQQRPCGAQRLCEGAPNGPGANVPPSVSRESHSTNSPAGGEPVTLIAQVSDDKDPVPPNIQRVEIVYRVDGGPEEVAVMKYDSVTGIQDGGARMPPRPLERWSLWTGEIPGQAQGSRVEFSFRVADAEGAVSARPDPLCTDGQGPCDAQFGGPGCLPDPASPDHFLPCDRPYRYTVGYEPPPELAALVINEVLASQRSILRNPAAVDPVACAGDGPERPDYCCDDDSPPTCGFDDVIEIVNTGDDPVDLSGLRLSDGWFQPWGWEFPPGSRLEGRGSDSLGNIAIVWCDGNGGRCPDPSRPDRPGFWDCPDPTDPIRGQYHTTFRLDAERDQIFLWDREERGFGLIAGFEFADQKPDVSLSLCPDADPTGEYLETPEPVPEGEEPLLQPTPGQPNSCPVGFRRGDPDNSCALDLTDGIFVLNYLFRGGRSSRCPDAADADDDAQVRLTDAVFIFRYLFQGGGPPPAPGPEAEGSDPTPDDLGPCFYRPCP